MTKKVRLPIATVNIGHLELNGILLDDSGKAPVFGIAFPQVYKALSVTQTNGTRKLKALLGKDLTLTQKVFTEVHDRSVNVLTLDEFDDVLFEASIKGNPAAIELSRVLRKLAMQQLLCDAFKIKFTAEERQEWIKERQSGKFYRRTFTDAVKYLKDADIAIRYDYVTMTVYKACNLHNQYLVYKSRNKDSKFRNTLNDTQLRKIAKMEELTADYIMVDGMSLEDAMQKAGRYIR